MLLVLFLQSSDTPFSPMREADTQQYPNLDSPMPPRALKFEDSCGCVHECVTVCGHSLNTCLEHTLPGAWPRIVC